MITQHKIKDTVFLTALFCSGAAALAFELMWTRLLSLILGAEVLGILGVLAGFFGGMVLGAIIMSRRAAASKRPIRTFFILEGVIVLFGALSPWLLFTLNDLIPGWLGPVTGDNSSLSALFIIVLLSGILLLPATFCMGANFAYLVEARRRLYDKQDKGRNVGRVYAANTAGAVAGTLLAVYLVIPSLGFTTSALVFSTISLLSIALIWLWKENLGSSAKQLAKSGKKAMKISVGPVEKKWMWLLFFTGLLAIGFEIIIIHLLKQVLENTVYTFANILSVYLLGTAIGAWIYQQNSRRLVQAGKVVPILLFSIIVWLILDIFMATRLHAILAAVSPETSYLTGHLIAEWLITSLFFFVPAFLMGVLFAYLFGKIHPTFVGRAYALNTLGATLAPFMFGLGLISWLGAFNSLLILAILYASLLLTFDWLFQWKNPLKFAGYAMITLTLFIPRHSFDFIQVEAGWKKIERKEGIMGTVAVSELPGQTGPLGLPLRVLHVNNRFRMGGGAGFVEKRMGHLPLLLSGKKDQVLFLGIGTGTTLSAATAYNDILATGVEIQPEVTGMLHLFSDHNENLLDNPNVQLHTADARRFVIASPDKYDLIVADLYHPARDGAGLLYSKEHFLHLKHTLKPGGSVMQWIPLYQFNTEDLHMVLRTFQAVFPETHLFLGGYNPSTPVLGVFGVTEPFRFDIGRINRTLISNYRIQRIFENPADLVATYICGPDGVKEFSGIGPINTDDDPALLFNAPKSAYIPSLELAKINLGTIAAIRNELDTDLFTSLAPGDLVSLKNYRKAAGYFIDHYVQLMNGNDEKSIRTLLQAYRTDPDFSPARGKLLEYVQTGVLSYDRVAPFLTEREKQRLGK